MPNLPARGAYFEFWRLPAGSSCWLRLLPLLFSQAVRFALITSKRQLHKLMDFVLGLRTRYPAFIARWKEYDGFIFTWVGNGLQRIRKKQLAVTNTTAPADLETLLQEIKSGQFRQVRPPIASLQQAADIALKLA